MENTNARSRGSRLSRRSRGTQHRSSSFSGRLVPHNPSHCMASQQPLHPPFRPQQHPYSHYLRPQRQSAPHPSQIQPAPRIIYSQTRRPHTYQSSQAPPPSSGMAPQRPLTSFPVSELMIPPRPTQQTPPPTQQAPPPTQQTPPSTQQPRPGSTLASPQDQRPNSHNQSMASHRSTYSCNHPTCGDTCASHEDLIHHTRRLHVQKNVMCQMQPKGKHVCENVFPTLHHLCHHYQRIHHLTRAEGLWVLDREQIAR